MKDVAPAIERLGVPAYNWWNEALHGVARSGLATVFPQAIGFAATWDDSLMFRMATVISDEARAKHHEYVRNGSHGSAIRGSRSGRRTSTSSAIRAGDAARRRTAKIRSSPAGSRVQFIRGLQGDDPKYFKTVATAKHFAVHSGPEPERHAFDAVVSERDLRETLPAALRDGHSRRRRVLADVRLQPRRRQGRRAAATCCSRTSCAASGVSRLHRLRLRRDRRHLPAPQGRADRGGGRRARREDGHRPRLRPRVSESRRGGEAGPDHRGARSTRRCTRLFLARFKLGMFDPPEHVR